MKYQKILVTLAFIIFALFGCASDDDSDSDSADDIPSIPSPLSLYAEIGPDDAIIWWTPDHVEAVYKRSSDPNCDFSNHESCASNNASVFYPNSLTSEHAAFLQNKEKYNEHAPLTDEHVSTTSQAYIQLESGSKKATFSLPGEKFSEREEHQIVEFDGKLYLIGGSDGTTYYNDVWVSTDGVNWSELTDNGGFPARWEHQVVAFKDKLYLIGGNDGNDSTNDIWDSTDGVNWTKLTDDASFDGRVSHQVVAFDDGDGEKLYLIGGFDGSNTAADVWDSTDGVNWSEATDDGGFSPRESHQVVALKDKLYLIGGFDGDNTSDVWYSTDGVNWSEATDDGGFSPRMSHQVVAFKDKLYLIGGNDGANTTSDLWNSTDGVHWEEVTSDNVYSARERHQVAVLNDEMYLIGGKDDDNVALNDIWSYNSDWNKEERNIKFSPRSQHQMTVINERIYLTGGKTGDAEYENDHWYSDDGFSWTRDQTPDLHFSARGEHQVVAFEEKLYVIGGGIDDDLTSDIWYFSDGVEWMEAVDAAGFSARRGHQVVVFNDGTSDKMFLIGGATGDAAQDLTSDVWYSSDGVVWTNATDDASFDGRAGHQVVVFDVADDGTGDKMFLIGGATGDTAQDLTSDVWYSPDGVVWMEVTSDGGFCPRKHHQVVVFDVADDATGDKMFLIGGEIDGDLTSDVWYSLNGVDWTEATDDAAFSPRAYHQVIVLDDKMYLTGGVDENGDPNDDVWSSKDGVTWRRLEYIESLKWINK